jgi:hypothetical protein
MEPIIITEPILSTGQWMLVIGVALVILQFLYRYWDKKDNKEIIRAISVAVSHFGPHVENTKRTYGIVKDLKRMHDVRDDDGRPIWYMPKEIIETQRKIVELIQVQAATQDQVVRLLARMDEKIDEHKADCKNQFNQLDKKTEKL